MDIVSSLREFDKEIYNAIVAEESRQEAHIELIASENYASKAVMQAQGSQLTNKYAEGYPDKRYYGGCEHVDVVEKLAIQRAGELFGAVYVNVQPHSGSQANQAVYAALLSPGDTVMGMKLDAGGHLTHGASVNFSGKIYNFVGYGVNEQGAMDYAEIRELAVQHKPKMIVAGFSAYSGTVDWKEMRAIADAVGAYLFVDMAHVAGLVAAGVYSDPVPYAHVVTSTTHKTLGGPRGGIILSGVNDSTLHKKLNSAVFPGCQGGPLMHIIAAKAVCFKEAMTDGFKQNQVQVVQNAKAMVEVFQQRGYKIVSGGTENHLFLVDFTDKGLTGKEAEHVLGTVGITVNKNSVPNETQSPFVTSGIRIGTPACTRRGFGIQEVKTLASAMCDLIDAIDTEEFHEVQEYVGSVVADLCQQYPVYC